MPRDVPAPKPGFDEPNAGVEEEDGVASAVSAGLLSVVWPALGGLPAGLKEKGFAAASLFGAGTAALASELEPKSPPSFFADSAAAFG